jgi:ParB family chromosome partitioning protein
VREKLVARSLDVGKLRVSKLNPRRGPGDVAELAASIRKVGLLQPLLVTPDGNAGYLVLAGQRRLAAAKEVGLARVPCVVRRMDEREREVAMLVENVHRLDLTPLEQATVYVRLMKLYGLSQYEVGEAVGKSQTHISMHLAYLRLPKETIRRCEVAEISFSEAMGLGDYRDFKHKPKKPQGRKSLHSLQGHESCDGRRCEVARELRRAGAA